MLELKSRNSEPEVSIVFIDPTFDPGDRVHVDFVAALRREAISRDMGFDHFVGLNVSEHQARAFGSNDGSQRAGFTW